MTRGSYHRVVLAGTFVEPDDGDLLIVDLDEPEPGTPAATWRSYEQAYAVPPVGLGVVPRRVHREATPAATVWMLTLVVLVALTTLVR